ncbi:MAG: phosphoenolpyruvate--protein phosphotransferase [Candidatus Competibacteraceae bacterium]
MRHSKQNITLAGRGITPGLAMGKAFIYHQGLQRNIKRYRIGDQQVGQEYSRIEDAIAKVREDLQTAAERVEQDIGPELADIFRAHELILYSSSLIEDLRAELELERVNAEQIVKRVFQRQERRLRQLHDAAFSQRADDLVDLGCQILQALTGIQRHTLEHMPSGYVLVTRRLLPSDTIFLSRKTAVAVVMEEGGVAGHAALLTREMGIPTVAQVPNLFTSIAPEDNLLVDGVAGTLTIEPEPATCRHFERRLEQQRALLDNARKHCHEPARTRDGVQIEVMVNTGYREDTALVLDYGVDGIGLYRIEDLYLACKAVPTEEELFAAIDEALAPLERMPIHIRLLDAGGDKNPPCLDLPAEDNPFLGRRGVRLLLAYPNLLHTQLRVLLRLSGAYAIRILVPMVTLAEEMAQVRSLLAAHAAELGIPMPALGAMIETPAAALCVRDIVRYADFISVGTNDLTQYTMAAGRDDPLVCNYFIERHPAVLHLLRLIVQEAAPIPVSLCGQMAGCEDAIGTLLQLGFRCLSVAPMQVPMVKQTIRSLSIRTD